MTFLYPYVLTALIIPALLAALAVVQRRRAGQSWRKLISPKHPELVQRRPHWQELLPPALALLALAGIVLAAARPINGYTQSEGAATGRNLLIALDISRSMETQDVSPSRLEEARAAAYELIDALPGDKIGLIVFSGEADVVVPLTYDHTALRDALEQVNRNWAGYGGTNFGILLRCAMQNFARSAPDGANALVILSDGEDTVDSSLQIAEEAKASRLLVITVGIGTQAGGAIPDPQGENGLWEDSSGRHVISKLDMNALQKFSQATGGDFFAMSSGADLTAFAREAANKLDRHEETIATGKTPLDLFAWFALPSLLALAAAIFLGSEWRAARHVRLIAALLLALAGNASAGPQQDAYSQGVQALHDGKADEAREKLSVALLSQDARLQAAVHLALGNMQMQNTFDKLRRLYELTPEGQAASPGVEALQGIVDELKKNLTAYQDALLADKNLSAASKNTEKTQQLIQKLEEEIERLKQQQNQQDQQQNNDDKQNQQQDQQQNNDDKQNQQDPQQGNDDKQNQQDPQQGNDDKQDQQDSQQQGDDDKQDQQDSQQGNDDKQNQQQDQQQGNDDKQDQQDSQQQGDDDKQNQQDPQQGDDDKQNQQDSQQQGNDDKQNQQDSQQQGNDDKQNQQDSQQGNDDTQNQQGTQPMTQPDEPSNEEKIKQRAAGILRMHLDEEKGSPIPHDTRTIRPPTKDY